MEIENGACTRQKSLESRREVPEIRSDGGGNYYGLAQAGKCGTKYGLRDFRNSRQAFCDGVKQQAVEVGTGRM